MLPFANKSVVASACAAMISVFLGVDDGSSASICVLHASKISASCTICSGLHCLASAATNDSSANRKGRAGHNTRTTKEDGDDGDAPSASLSFAIA